MQNILNASVLYRALSAFFSYVGVKWHESRIVTWFLKPNEDKRRADATIFTRLARRLHRLLAGAFKKLGLTRVMENSLFRQAFIWCLLPLTLAPFLPTMALLCLVVVGVLTLGVRFGTDGELRANYSPINKFILLYAACYLIATLTSVTVSGSLLTGLLSALFTLFAVVLDNAVTSRRQADLALRLLVLAGAAVAAYGLYQFVFYSPASRGAWIDKDMFSDVTNRVYSTLDNPNVLSEYLLLVIPFAAALFLTGKNAVQKLLYAACLIVMALCMVLTQSRGGYLGLLFAAAIFLFMLDARFILLGVVALAALYFVLPHWVITRFTSIGDMSDSSTSYRVYIWLGTLAMLKDYWLCGIGPGTAAFNLVYPAYGFNTVSAPHSHNLFLQAMCDGGIAVLVLFLLILVSFYRSAFSSFSRERDKTSRIYLIAAVSSVSGFLLQSFTDYTFYNNRVMLLFWVVIGLGSVLARRSQLEEGQYLWSRS